MIDLAKLAGLILDEWQQTHLTAALGETESGKWAALEVGEVVPRQNGKNGELEARQLGGLFIIESPLSIHSAHMADTSLEQFLRIEGLIEGTPELSRRVAKVTRGKGSEEILLKRHPRTGVAPRLRFRPRTGSGGRGFSCDDLYLDEAMILPEAFHGTLMPTLSARPNPQVWYTGSAPDEEDPAHHGVVIARLRERAIRGDDPSLVYAEHSIDLERPDEVTAEMAMDPALWAQANPALGIRITPEYVEREQRSMSARAFAVERLGVGQWPRTDGLEGIVITPPMWAACTDPDSKLSGNICLVFDLPLERGFCSIAAAGRRADGLPHLEMVDRRLGTGWVIERMVELVRKHKPVAVLCSTDGGAFSLVPEMTAALKKAGVLGRLKDSEITLVGSKEHAQACGMIFDAVKQETFRHLGEAPLNEAIRGALRRNMQDAWKWSRRDSTVDISPLVAFTLGLWGVTALIKPQAAAVLDMADIEAEMREAGELV